MPIFEDYLIAKLITKIDFRKVFAFSAFTTWGKEETCSFFCIYNMGTWGMGKEFFVFSAFTTRGKKKEG